MGRPPKIRVEPQTTEQVVVSDEVTETKLSAIVEQFEAILKPFQHTLKVEVDKANGLVSAVGISVKFLNPR